jgi:hypothetical protein
VSDQPAIIREIARYWFKTTRDGRDYIGIGRSGAAGFMFPIEDSSAASYVRFNVREVTPDPKWAGDDKPVHIYEDLEAHTTGWRSRFIQRRIGPVRSFDNTGGPMRFPPFSGEGGSHGNGDT